MKNKLWIALLGIEAVLCVVLSAVSVSASDTFAVVVSFPFKQLGMLLRALSLSGDIGNAFAIVIYTALGLLPLVVLLMLKLKSVLRGEDVLLVLLSAAVFEVLYLMTNPGDIKVMFYGDAGIDVGKAFLGGTVYSILCGWLVLRVLRLFFTSGTAKLQKYLNAVMYLLSGIFVFAIFGTTLAALLESFKTLEAGNQGGGRQLGASYVFLVLQFIVDVIPYVMDLLIVFAAKRLLSDMRDDRYSEQVINSAGRLSRWCKVSLTVTVLTQVAFNILQLLFIRNLMVINGRINIPVLSIVFVLVILLLSRYLADSKRLKDDNDMFI